MSAIFYIAHNKTLRRLSSAVNEERGFIAGNVAAAALSKTIKPVAQSYKIDSLCGV